MTQRNIDVMDIIVSKMAEGDKFSKALSRVYTKRNVHIPYRDDIMNVSVMDLGMPGRSTNSMMRAKLKTIGDIVDFCSCRKITDIPSVGKNSGIEVFEAVLDYCWNHMSEKDQVFFLIDTVERNANNIREDIA